MSNASSLSVLLSKAHVGQYTRAVSGPPEARAHSSDSSKRLNGWETQVQILLSVSTFVVLSLLIVVIVAEETVKGFWP